MHLDSQNSRDSLWCFISVHVYPVWRVPLDKIKICKIFKKSFSKHQKVFRKLCKCVLKILKRKFSKFFSQMPCLDLHATSHHPNVDGGCVQPHLWHLACKLIQMYIFWLNSFCRYLHYHTLHPYKLLYIYYWSYRSLHQSYPYFST